MFKKYLAILLTCCTPLTANAWVDLHAHWFLADEFPMGIMGSFNGAIRSTDWRDRFSSRVNPSAIQQSGNTIAVVSLYATPLYFRPLRSSIRHQIRMAQEFLRTHPEWVQAKTPAEAVSARASGKKTLILSLEGASGILETETDFQEFIDQAGIAIVTFQHFLDDDLGGAANMHGPQILLNPTGLWNRIFRPHYSRGITARGRVLLSQLMARNVWIDFAHLSAQSFLDLSEVYRQKNWPILVTHTALSALNPAERSLNADQAALLKASNGIVGLIPSQAMMNPAPDQPLQAFQAQWALAQRQMGTESVFIGSDINAPLSTLPSEQHEHGYFHLGLFHELARTLGLKDSERSEAVFLKTWARIRK